MPANPRYGPYDYTSSTNNKDVSTQRISSEILFLTTVNILSQRDLTSAPGTMAQRHPIRIAGINPTRE